MELKRAASVFPLNYSFRIGPAIGMVSLAERDPRLKEAALEEIEAALVTDPASPELLAFAITLELDMNQDAAAKAHYQLFKRVARNSPLVTGKP